MNKKNITTMVLASLALFIYMLLLGTFIPIGRSYIMNGRWEVIRWN